MSFVVIHWMIERACFIVELLFVQIVGSLVQYIVYFLLVWHLSETNTWLFCKEVSV